MKHCALCPEIISNKSKYCVMHKVDMMTETKYKSKIKARELKAHENSIRPNIPQIKDKAVVRREIKEYTCNGCGIKFLRKETNYTTNNSTFCSQTCNRKHFRPTGNNL